MPHDARARQVAHLGVGPHAEREHIEALVAGDERVRLLAREMDEAVTGTDLVRLALLPRQPGAAEDPEDLLLFALRVNRRRAFAAQDLDAVDADGHRSRGLSELR